MVNYKVTGDSELNFKTILFTSNLIALFLGGKWNFSIYCSILIDCQIFLFSIVLSLVIFPTMPQSVSWDATSMNKSVNLSLIFKINPGVLKETS